MDRHTLTEKYLPGRESALLGNVILVPIKAPELLETVRTLAIQHALPFISMVATDERYAHKCFRIHYIFGVPAQKDAKFIALVLDVTDEFPTLARDFAWATMYEREIKEMFGITPIGSPDSRTRVLYEENWPKNTYPLRKDFAWDSVVPETHCGDYPFKKVEGEGVYEVPVGPVHAGIIEPGHFRFSMAGEDIVNFENRMGWVHKGAEKLFENLPTDKHLKLAENISGDSSFAHALAYVQAVEILSGVTVPERAAYLRSIFAELERLTMHLFDVGNIVGNGTAFSVLGQHAFRMCEELRQWSDMLTDSRFLRGVAVVGGVSTDISTDNATDLTKHLANLQKDLADIVEIFSRSSIFLNRVRTTGIVPKKVAEDFRALGVAARASGVSIDVRVDFPYAAYTKHSPAVAVETAGDVEARLNVRIKEIAISIDLITQMLEKLPKGDITTGPGKLPVEGMSVSLVEGRLGEVAYVVIVEKGAISRVKVRDASFINWQLPSHMTSSDIVPDFPLINKSFNLSYSGNDL